MISFLLGFGSAVITMIILIAWYGSGPVEPEEPEEKQTFDCPQCGAELEMVDKDDLPDL